MADFQNNFLSALQGGLQFGQQVKANQDQNRLSALFPQTYGAPKDQRQQMLGQIASVSPQAAAAQRKQWSADDQADQEELVNMARFIKSAPPGQQQQVYQSSVLPKLRERGMQAPDWTPQTQSEILQTVDALVNAYGGGGGQTELAPRVVGDALVDSTGKVLYQSPQQQDYQWSDRAGAWIPKPMTGDPQMQGMPATSTPQTEGMGQLDFAGDLRQFASLGVPVSSTRRSAVKNNEVGGVGNSYHLTGEAADIVPRTPQEKQQSRQYWESRGYQVIDEGDHLHIEPPRRGMTSSQVGGDPQQGQVPPLQAIPVAGISPRGDEENAPSGYRFGPDGTLSPIPGGPADKQNNPVAADLAKGEMGLRKEIQDRVKSDRTILGMYTNVQNAANTPSAAGDLSLIFAFMKMLDPGSVVREQEFANAQNAAGVPDQVRNAYNRAKSGERLNPSQRADFVNQARNLADAATGRITAVTREYQGIADQYGWDPTRATGQADFRGVSSSVGQPSQVARPTSDAEYNALPSGAIFIDPDDGKQYRKP